MRRLKAGVAGAGAFGRHHARIYAGLENVVLTTVYDQRADAAQALGDELGAKGVGDLDALLAEVDILTVATPAVSHAAIAQAALAAGKSVYVEKPPATTLAEAQALVAAAARTGAVLACGLQERVVSKAMGLLDVPEAPVALEAERCGPWNPRNTDVSCVLDLMIHDIDLALTLNPAAIGAVRAQGRTTEGPFLDEVSAQATLADGAQLSFTASRIAEARRRRMRVVYPSGEVEIDFVNRTFRNTTPFALNEAFAETPEGQNPLKASVAAFVAAAAGEGRPAVTAEEALKALALALAIEAACAG